LAYTAIYIASLNVKINVDSMENDELDNIQVNSDEILSKSKVLIEEIRVIVAERMS
jgi:formiminotetrahydrofolate cyclodeaminase